MDGQSYLLLIRDEGGPPELQVSPTPFPQLLCRQPCKNQAFTSLEQCESIGAVVVPEEL